MRLWFVPGRRAFVAVLGAVRLMLANPALW